MRTFEESIKQHLQDNGMFPKQAIEVFEATKAAKENKEMARRWQDDPKDYSDIMLNICKISANSQALIWIDKNCPEAWYRPLFAQGKE